MSEYKKRRKFQDYKLTIINYISQKKFIKIRQTYQDNDLQVTVRVARYKKLRNALCHIHIHNKNWVILYNRNLNKLRCTQGIYGASHKTTLHTPKKVRTF